MVYDGLASSYDDHFRRPVDHWEDDRLAWLLAPSVVGRSVLDLGCGTGWVPDHLDPSDYTGVDRSGPMLNELMRKHSRARVVKVTVGTPGWQGALPPRQWDTITCTWALQYLGDLGELLRLLSGLAPGGTLALHGYLPRYRRRSHVISPVPAQLPSRAAIRAATRAAGLSPPRCAGTGALPDSLARSRLAWSAALATPARWHYAALWTWQVPR